MSGTPIDSSPPDETDPRDTDAALRVALGGALHRGHVDGAWWPRSRDLRAELPTLLDWLGSRVGAVERVAFGVAGWDPVGARPLVTDEGRVRLEGFRSVEPSTVWFVVRGRGRTRTGLLVVPPDTSEPEATAIMRRASDDANHETPADLLRAPAVSASATVSASASASAS